MHKQQHGCTEAAAPHISHLLHTYYLDSPCTNDDVMASLQGRMVCTTTAAAAAIATASINITNREKQNPTEGAAAVSQY